MRSLIEDVSGLTNVFMNSTMNETDNSNPSSFFWNGDSTNSGGATATTGMEEEFDPRVFWCVNGFLMFMMLSVCLWCCWMKPEFFNNMHERRRQADTTYQQSLRDRLAREAARRIDSPEKRKQKLLQSFKRHKVQMTVKEEDLIFEEDSSRELSVSGDVEQQSNVEGNNNNDNDNDVEDQSLSTLATQTGLLRLASKERRNDPVPNCCAVCLGNYEVGDKVVWSSNPKCKHAFHQSCILDWLVKMQPATPCPCCRQEFTDLERVRAESKIIWAGSNTSAWASIGF